MVCKFCSVRERKNKSIHIDIVDDKADQRPIMREAAKEQRKGKDKADQVMNGIFNLEDKINRIVEVTQEHKESEKVTQAQLEISTLNLQMGKTGKGGKIP